MVTKKCYEKKKKKPCAISNNDKDQDNKTTKIIELNAVKELETGTLLQYKGERDPGTLEYIDYFAGAGRAGTSLLMLSFRAANVWENGR